MQQSNSTEPDNGDAPPLQCKLLDAFAVVIQVMMAGIALSSLIVKRHRETPRRPLLIWVLDTSKQAIAAGVIHFANIFISYVSGGSNEAEVANPCVWYFLNILLDTTVGVGILYGFLRLFHGIAEYYKVVGVESGVYGSPPKFTYWARQLGLFLISWFCVKVVVVVGLQIFPWLSIIADILLLPLQKSGNTQLQVVFVMLIFPLIMNIVQAWLIDMVIKGKISRPSSGGGGEEDYLVFEDNDGFEYQNVNDFEFDEDNNNNSAGHSRESTTSGDNTLLRVLQ